MSNEIHNDPELLAMSKALEALSPLEPEARTRVINWLVHKHGLTPASVSSNAHQNDARQIEPKGLTREGTINTVAVRMGVKSCRDLMVAAAVHLTLYQGKDRFSRADWVSCAKEAKQWKTDYSVQTSTQISRLLNSGFVNETAKDIYVVPDDQIKRHSEALA
jgi:hypothetical protein